MHQKLKLARLPANLDNEQWAEKNGVTVEKVKHVLEYWQNSYNWRDEEARLNNLPQYMTNVHVSGFGELEMHFMHSTSAAADAVPLLFIHGWPGSFAEVTKILPILNEAGFHVVAPSLPGYGYSQCPDKPGFTNEQDAEAVHQLMTKLGYSQYVVQGGDWGSGIARNVGKQNPEQVKAVHINHINVVSAPLTPGSLEFSGYSLTPTDHNA